MRTHFPFNLQYTLDLIIFLIYNIGHLLQLKNIIHVCVYKTKAYRMNCWSVQWRTLHVHHRSRLSISHVKISRIKLGLHAREHLNPLTHLFLFYVFICSSLIDPMNVSFVYLANYFIVCPCPLSIPKPLLLQLAVPLICHSESRYIYWYQFDMEWSSLPNHLHVPHFFVAQIKIIFHLFSRKFISTTH